MRYLHVLIAFGLISTPAYAQGRGPAEQPRIAAPGTLAPARCVRTNLRGGGSLVSGVCSTTPATPSGDVQKLCSASRVRSCPPKSEG